MPNRSRTSHPTTSWSVVLALGLGFAFTGGVLAQDQWQPQDLRQPYEMTADNGVLNLELSVGYDPKKKTPFFSEWSKEGSDCFEAQTVSASLRMYGYTNPKGDSPYACGDEPYCYNFPGPTLRVWRNPENPSAGPPGTQLSIELYNHMPPTELEGCIVNGEPYDWDGDGPNCFHGPQITNFHFHGFHVSPNPNPPRNEKMDLNEDGTYSDYIYVSIYPKASKIKGEYVTNKFPETKVGSAKYRLRPLTKEQHEGTHWYHPHKHGSTALQLGNGMAGALIVEGPYDAWLRGQICGENSGCLEEKVLIVQEILWNFIFPPPKNPDTENPLTTVQNSAKLVNGQLYPTLNIAPGEIQRWRIVNAEMKAGGAFYFRFPQGVVARQIGMDGVPFVKDNYIRQPLLGEWRKDPDDGKEKCMIPTEKGTVAKENLCILLHPGNRADFLVQRQPESKKAAKRRARRGIMMEADTVSLVHHRKFFAPDILERRDSDVEEPAGKEDCTDPKPGQFKNKPGLFRLNDCTSGGPGCEPKKMNWPNLDNYPDPKSLRDIDSAFLGKSITYKMQGYTGAEFNGKCLNDGGSCNDSEKALLDQINRDVGPCKLLLPKFTINGEQFEGNKCYYGMVENTSEHWTFPNVAQVPDLPVSTKELDAACPGLGKYVTNKDCPGDAKICLIGDDEFQMQLPVPEAIQHPVHLHVNPFQVIDGEDGRKEGPPYVWQDVMGIAVGGSGSAEMQTTFADYTGQFVMHCHILGHEDRGMMQNLVVCGKDGKGCPKKADEYTCPDWTVWH